ncbi:hypothetical protein Bbelb_278740 [Branchiostoma belcheri]|nr:hypothetical protein Bbelb_278740 [Branchiostoma belcheri]
MDSSKLHNSSLRQGMNNPPPPRRHAGNTHDLASSGSQVAESPRRPPPAPAEGRLQCPDADGLPNPSRKEGADDPEFMIQGVISLDIVSLDKVRVLDSGSDFFARGIGKAVCVGALQPSLGGGGRGAPRAFCDL